MIYLCPACCGRKYARRFSLAWKRWIDGPCETCNGYGHGHKPFTALAFVERGFQQARIADSVIAALDARRSAKLLVDQHAVGAPIMAAQRADEPLAAGDIEGRSV